MEDVFRQNGWHYERVPQAFVFQLGFEAHHGRIPLHVQVFPEIRALSVVSNPPLRTTDPDRRALLAELLMRTNEQLTLGAFELCWDDGQPLFRVSHFLPEADPVHPLLTVLVEIAIVETDRILPLLHRLIQTPPEQIAGLDLKQLLEEAQLPAVPAPFTTSQADS